MHIIYMYVYSVIFFQIVDEKHWPELEILVLVVSDKKKGTSRYVIVWINCMCICMDFVCLLDVCVCVCVCVCVYE